MDRRPLVCLVLEGTYPYVRGGVSSWAHQLIQSLPEFDFFLYTLSARADQNIVFEIPENVVGMKDVILQTTGFELTGRPMRSRGRVAANATATATATATPATAGRTTMRQRLTDLRRLLGPTVDDSVTEMLSELDAVASLREHAAERHLSHLAGLIPGYRGGKWLAALEQLWQDIVGDHLSTNPYYGLGEYFWTWYNSRVMLLRLVEEELPPADLYHSLCTGYAGFMAARSRAEHNRPYILTEHGIYHRERLIEIEATDQLRGHQRDMWGEVFLALSRVSYRAADRVITLFRHNQNLEQRMGAPPERCEVVPNGIDIPRFSAVTREKRSGFHVGLVGRVVPIKDIKTFLVAARIIAESIPSAHFHIVGPTDESPEYYEECLDMTAAFGMTDQVTYTGPADVRDYYAFIDVLVLTSLSEAQPLVILEAVAAGVPCVATRVGDVPDLLNNDDRLIAAPKDAEGIAGRIMAIHYQPEAYREWIEERQATLRRVYDKQVIFNRYGEIYREYCGGAP